MVKRSRTVSRNSRKLRTVSRKQRGGQMTTTRVATTTAKAGTTTTRVATTTAKAGTTATAVSKVVKVYVKVPSTGIIDLASIKSSDPLVTAKAGGTKQVTLGFDPSLGKLKDINYKGHGAKGWVAASPAKIFMGSVGTMITAKHATNASKSVMRATALPAPTATSLKLPLDVATLGNGLKIMGLEQGNFATFSTTGNAANGGANILIELTF